MAVLGVILCEVLELEFAHLLASDSDVDRITVVETPEAKGLVQAFEALAGAAPDRVAAVRSFAADPSVGLDVLVHVLELALHRRKQLLQQGLVAAARELAPHVDALFLGYGLCGNALEHPEHLLGEFGVPIFVPMDGDHPVDDCVGLVIGGREEYYGEQCRVAGTFFMTPGWTRHWQRMFDAEFGNLSLELAKRLFANYERSLLISTPLMGMEEMRGNVAEFNRSFDCRTESREGTLHLLEGAWTAAKRSLTRPSH